MARKLTIARIEEIEKRQLPRAYGPMYKAAMRATRAEAPSGSRPAELQSAMLQRRVHTMSVAETVSACIAMAHPCLFEMWDQYMLGIGLEHHPLHGHPRGRGMLLPSTSGTLKLAEKMGDVRRHPKLRDRELELDVPVPLLGDLLLFLSDERGPYCLDWDIKRSEGDHGKPLRIGRKKIAAKSEMKRAAFKDELRLLYMGELGIRTVRISLDTFDKTFRQNMVKLQAVHAACSPLAPEVQYEIIETFRDMLPQAYPPLTVISRFVQRGIRPELVTEVMHQAIWYGKLRVDLFQQIRTDIPLCPEQRAPFLVYAACFAR